MEKRTNKSKKKIKLKTIFFNLTIFMLFAIGLIFIFNKPVRNSIIAAKTNSYQISKITSGQIKKNQKKTTQDEGITYDFNNVEPVSSENVYKALAAGTNLPVIGGIAIPELNMNLPIFKGLQSDALYYGAGTMKENQVMGSGNYTLASHHVFGMTGASNMLFSPLDKAKSGMLIYITDKDKIYTYQITEVSHIDPTQVDVLNDTDKAEITLITCTDMEATARILVKGELINTENYSDASSDIIKAFNVKYNQIQG